MSVLKIRGKPSEGKSGVFRSRRVGRVQKKRQLDGGVADKDATDGRKDAEVVPVSPHTAGHWFVLIENGERQTTDFS